MLTIPFINASQLFTCYDGLNCFRQPLHFTPNLVFIIAVCVLSLLVWRLWRFTISPKLYPKDVTELPYWIPILGQTLSFFRNTNSTLTRGVNYVSGSRKVFGITVAGAKIYVVASANEAIEVSKNTYELVFDDYIKDLMAAMGHTAEGAGKMWQPQPESMKGVTHPSRYPNPHGKCLIKITQDALRVQLLPGSQSTALYNALLTDIHNSLSWKNLRLQVIPVTQPLAKCFEISLTKWCQKTLLEAVTNSVFGPSLLLHHPELLESFSEFDENSWHLTYRIPKPWSNKMEAAKKRCIESLGSYFLLPSENRTGACWVITALETEMRASGMQESDMAASLLMAFWAINANSWKHCFWIMAYILESPNLSSIIRQEVLPVFEGTDSPCDIADGLDGCPQLMSVFHESMRLVASSVSVRNVARPLEVGGKLLRPGYRVLVPHKQILMDKAAFGFDSDTFNAARFLNDPLLSKSPSFKPFGSGTTHCPGRFLAQKEILTFVATAFVRYDIRKSTNSRLGNQFPRADLAKPCLGIMAPVKGDDVVLVIRPLCT